MKNRKSLNIETEAWIVYGLLQNLEYQMFYALSEYVDNSVQSFLDDKDLLENDFVSVEIDYDIDDEGNEYIKITDDAGGISEERFDDAFRLTDPDGLKGTLNEFGLGMKMASLWLGNKFTVKTSAIGEDYATTVIFDLDFVQKAKVNQIDGDNLYTEKESKEKHYTIITVEKTNHFPKGSASKKIITHLADIYRIYLRDGILKLRFGDREVHEDEPDWLTKPYWDNHKQPYPAKKIDQEFEWRKEFNIKLPPPYDYAKGHVGLHEKMQRATSGLVIFRRGRAVAGTGEERYRPQGLFGASQSQKFARLFGEVHFGPNAPVSSNKRLVWTEVEAEFVLRMKDILAGDVQKFKAFLDGDVDESEVDLQEILPISKMGTEYRVETERKLSSAKLKEHAQTATSSTGKVFEEGAKNAVDPLIENPVSTSSKEDSNTDDIRSLSTESINVNFSGQDWHVTFKVLEQAGKPLYIFKKTEEENSIELSINISHAFIKNFIDREGKIMTAFLRIASGLALAEIVSEQTQNKEPSSLRHNFNSIMGGSLSRKK
tara:strand:+ start:55 stop:1686 length:1632 start_codon:yes stop_codon:yes gene_type:complete